MASSCTSARYADRHSDKAASSADSIARGQGRSRSGTVCRLPNVPATSVLSVVGYIFQPFLQPFRCRQFPIKKQRPGDLGLTFANVARCLLQRLVRTGTRAGTGCGGGLRKSKCPKRFPTRVPEATIFFCFLQLSTPLTPN